MKLRTLFATVLILSAGVAAPSAFARGILADWGSTAAACNLLNPTGPADLTLGSGSLAGDFNPNISGAAFSAECDLPSSVTADDQLGNSVSGLATYLWNSSATVVAGQIVDYSLSGGDQDFFGTAIGGFTEIEFNYSFTVPCSTQSATLTWGGATYTATCANANITSLLFNSAGVLQGWLDDTNTFTSGLTNSGWSSGTTTAPEPGMLALVSCAFLPAVLWLRRRAGRS